MHGVDQTAVRINGEETSLHALMRRARARGQLQFLEDAISASLVRSAADQLGISVSKEDLQQAANTFREKNGLLKAQDMMRWLEERGLSVSEWQGTLHEDVLVAKFKQRFESKVPTYFAEHKLEFDLATIGRIASTSEGLASELLLQIKEEGAVFEDVARKYSTDKKTKDVGGYVGKIRRKDLGPAASSAVFGGASGSVHGPFKSGKEFHILRVIALHPATLDADTKELIKERMFSEWLAESREKANIEVPLFEATPVLVETA